MPDRIFSQISLPAVCQVKITTLFKRHILPLAHRQFSFHHTYPFSAQKHRPIVRGNPQNNGSGSIQICMPDFRYSPHFSRMFMLKKTSNTGNIQKMFVREAYKPSSVIGGHLSRPIVTKGFKRNPESSTGRLKRSFVSCCGWGLHRGRVARPRVSSYLTFQIGRAHV